MSCEDKVGILTQDALIWSFYLSFYPLSIYIYHLSIHPSNYLSTHIYLSIYLYNISIYPSIHQTVHPSINQSIYSSKHQSPWSWQPWPGWSPWRPPRAGAAPWRERPFNQKETFILRSFYVHILINERYHDQIMFILCSHNVQSILICTFTNQAMFILCSLYANMYIWETFILWVFMFVNSYHAQIMSYFALIRIKAHLHYVHNVLIWGMVQ